MSDIGLSSGENFLIRCAQTFFATQYANPPMAVGKEFDKNLEWAPALQVSLTKHLTYFIQPSEDKVYPRIFSLRHADVLHVTAPIAIFSVCPAEVINSAGQEKEKRLLKKHGYGLISVSKDGACSIEFRAIPLIQQIAEEEFQEESKGLPKKIKRDLALAYDDYLNNPVAGVASVSEIVEGMVLRAAKDCAKQGWLEKKDAKPGQSAAMMLDKMYMTSQCQNILAQIGGVRSFVSEYRNLTAHFPKNKKRAFEKYRKCRHGFIDGIKHIQRFRSALKSLGLSGLY